MASDWALHPAHDTIRHRQGKDQRGDSRDGKGRVHHGSGAGAVGQYAAAGPEDGGRNGIGRANHARGRDAEAVDTGQIAWQPKRERDEAAKDEEIIKPKAPDLQIFQRSKLQPKALLIRATGLAQPEHRVVAGADPKHNSGDGEVSGPHLSDSLPAPA